MIVLLIFSILKSSMFSSKEIRQFRSWMFADVFLKSIQHIVVDMTTDDTYLIDNHIGKIFVCLKNIRIFNFHCKRAWNTFLPTFVEIHNVASISNVLWTRSIAVVLPLHRTLMFEILHGKFEMISGCCKKLFVAIASDLLTIKHYRHDQAFIMFTIKEIS